MGEPTTASIIQGLSSGSTSLDTLRKLNETLVTVTDTWLESFLKSGGVKALLEVINENRTIKSGVSGATLEQCMITVDFLIESDSGRDDLMNHANSIRVIVHLLQLRDWQLRARIFRLLSFLCLMPPKGHDIVIDALKYFNEQINARREYSFIIKCLKNPDAPVDVLTQGLALINSLVSIPEDLDDRMAIRNKLLKLKIGTLINSFKETWAKSSEELEAQIQVWEEECEEDEKQKKAWMGSRIGGVPKNDPNKLFQLLQGSAQSDPDAAQAFLAVMQTMAMMTSANEGTVWKGFDSLLKKYYLVASNNKTPDKIEVIPAAQYQETIKSLENKIRDLNKEVQRDQQNLAQLSKELEQSKSAPPAGGPPPPGGDPSPPPAGGPPPPGGGPAPPGGGPPPPGGGPPPPGGGPAPPGGGPPPPGGGPPPPGGGGGPPPPGGGPPGPPGGPPGAPGGAPKAAPGKPKRKPSCKMKQLNWQMIPANALDKSVWKGVDDTKISLDTAELESLFGVAERKEAAAPTSSDTAKKVAVSLIDPKRANNCAIMLTSRFRNVSYEDIKKAILDLDKNVIGEHLEYLVQYVPTTEEVEQISGFPGDPSELGKAEQFFLVIKDVPRLEGRLTALAFSIQYQNQYADLKPDITAVKSASDEVKNSPCLKKLLVIILAIGNYLNGQGFKGGAYGFKLDVLTKLKDTRAGNGQGTLLHYICKKVDKEHPELMNFPKELNHVPAAARANIPMLQSGLAKLKSGLNQVNKEIEMAKDGDKFKGNMGQFVSKATKDIEQLEKEEKEMETSFSEVLALFGERDGTTTETFFGVINAFVGEFMRSHAENVRKEAAAAKRAAAASAPARTPAQRTSPRPNAPQTGAGPAPNALAGMGDVTNQLKAGGFFKQRREEISASKIAGFNPGRGPKATAPAQDRFKIGGVPVSAAGGPGPRPGPGAGAGPGPRPGPGAGPAKSAPAGGDASGAKSAAAMLMAERRKNAAAASQSLSGK